MMKNIYMFISVISFLCAIALETSAYSSEPLAARRFVPPRALEDYRGQVRHMPASRLGLEVAKQFGLAVTFCAKGEIEIGFAKISSQLRDSKLKVNDQVLNGCLSHSSNYLDSSHFFMHGHF